MKKSSKCFVFFKKTAPKIYKENTTIARGLLCFLVAMVLMYVLGKIRTTEPSNVNYSGYFLLICLVVILLAVGVKNVPRRSVSGMGLKMQRAPKSWLAVILLLLGVGVIIFVIVSEWEDKPTPPRTQAPTVTSIVRPEMVLTNQITSEKEIAQFTARENRVVTADYVVEVPPLPQGQYVSVKVPSSGYIDWEFEEGGLVASFNGKPEKELLPGVVDIYSGEPLRSFRVRSSTEEMITLRIVTTRNR